jgi:hypothetical protein
MTGWLPIYEVRYYTYCGILLILLYITFVNNFCIKIIISIITIIFISGFTYNKYISWKNITAENVNITKAISLLKEKNYGKNFEIITDEYLQNKLIRNGIDNYYTYNHAIINSNDNNNLKIILLSQYDLNSLQIQMINHDSIENILRSNNFKPISITKFTKLYYK